MTPSPPRDRRLARIAAAGLCSAALGLACVAPALATQSGSFFSGGLSYARYYAAGAQSGMWQVHSDNDAGQTSCVGVEQGFAGYSPPGELQAIGPAGENCGNDPYNYPGSPSGGWHAYVYNPNGSNIHINNVWYWY